MKAFLSMPPRRKRPEMTLENLLSKSLAPSCPEVAVIPPVAPGFASRCAPMILAMTEQGVVEVNLLLGGGGSRQGRCKAGARPVQGRCKAGAGPVAERHCTGVEWALHPRWPAPSASVGTAPGSLIP